MICHEPSKYIKISHCVLSQLACGWASGQLVDKSHLKLCLSIAVHQPQTHMSTASRTSTNTVSNDFKHYKHRLRMCCPWEAPAVALWRRATHGTRPELPTTSATSVLTIPQHEPPWGSHVAGTTSKVLERRFVRRWFCHVGSYSIVRITSPAGFHANCRFGLPKTHWLPRPVEEDSKVRWLGRTPWHRPSY